jgi:Tfp pilus assembly protein PilX
MSTNLRNQKQRRLPRLSRLPAGRARLRQAGMVSIMVTLVLMIVISLLVLGFAQISRRNARQALDQQLSTQAFYAAESGVNDAANLIRQAIQNGETIPAKDTCGTAGGAGASFYGSLNPELDADADVAYTCLLVDPAPTTLRFSDVGTTSIVVPLTAASGNLNTVTLTWQTKDETNTPLDNCPTSTANAFPQVGNWECGYGVLRYDLVPTGGSFDAVSLQNRTMTSFLVPLATGGASNIPFAASDANTNTRPGVDCSNANCRMTITGLSGSQYYMRISSQYKNVSLQINATNGDGPVGLVGAQAVVDATGKAQDVLRRIQAHVPLTASSENLLSDYAIQSTDPLCKRFAVMSGYFENHVDDVAGGNPLCADP